MAKKKYSLIEMMKSDKTYEILCTQKQYDDLKYRVHTIKTLNGEEYYNSYTESSVLWLDKKNKYDYRVILFGANYSSYVNGSLYADMSIDRNAIKYSEIDLNMRPGKEKDHE